MCKSEVTEICSEISSLKTENDFKHHMFHLLHCLGHQIHEGTKSVELTFPALFYLRCMWALGYKVYNTVDKFETPKE